MKIDHFVVEIWTFLAKTYHSNYLILILNIDQGGKTAWIGDGFCDDKNNNQVCNYDDGDCCGVKIKKNFCVECKCKCKW